MEKNLLDANLIKKYNKDIFFNYSEYPTKDTWDINYNAENYKNSLKDWISENPNEPILFYVHTPFCEELCYFCFCSKEITQNYNKAENYLYNYLFKEIDLLFDYLKKNKLKLNVKEIYFGGGSPTYYKLKDFKKLVEKLNNYFDFNKIIDFTVEIDPRRVDEEKLLFYSDCGVSRLSFGVQDFDLEVQERINRVQPPELFDSLMTKKVREKFKVINFDILIGLPGQTDKSINNTLNKVIEIKPTQIQPMLMHYDPFKRKYMINMLKDGPLPDFYDRHIMFNSVKNKLTKGGYVRAGYESYALPNDPLIEAMENEKALYNSLGTQIGEAVNFIGIGSSANGCLGNDYYVQNLYEQSLYRKSLDENSLPIFRGYKLNQDDKIRRYLIQYLKTYFLLKISEIEQIFKLNFQKYFKEELIILKEFERDNLVIISKSTIEITEIGKFFAPQITNIFDKYNRIKSYQNQKEIIQRQKPVLKKI